MTGLAVNVIALPAQEGLLPAVNAILTEGTTVLLIVTVIPELVAVKGLEQPALEVITQLTTCPLVREEVVNVAEFVPALLPFTSHWYEGVVPPFTGVAVKVIDDPAQDGLLPEVRAIETEGTTVLFTFCVITLLPATAGLAQVAFDVRTQATS